MKNLISVFATLILTASAFATGVSSMQLTGSKAEAEANLRNNVFSGIARIGDSALCPPSCDWEMGLGANTNQWNQKKDTNWRNNQARDFSVNYNASNRQVTFTLAGNILRYNIQPGKKMDALVLKAQTTTCTAIRFDSLIFKNEAIGAGLRPSVSNGSTKYLRINNADLNKNWSMTGRVNFQWQGNPRGNQMHMEVRAMEAVPEPGTMLAITAGLSALAARRRRKSL